MKNFINSLNFININLASLISNISPDSIKETKKSNIIEYSLPIIPIVQENSYYHIATCIQMIFKYLDLNLNNYSQPRIFYDLNKNTNAGIINQEVANYLNTHIINSSNNYNFFNIDMNFGLNLSEQLLFQNYIFNSLINNFPLILGFGKPEQTDLALIITGIKINLTNPWLTKYKYINPLSSNFNEFEGNGLSNILSSESGQLIGKKAESTFKNNYNSI